MRVALVVLALLAGCRQVPDASEDAAPGRALEAAALRAGIVGNAGDAAGVYAAGEDRVCMSRAGPDRYLIGVSIDYGEGQRCLGRGTADGRGALVVQLAAGCRFAVDRDGDRLSFPAETPAACAPLCQGRASFDSLAFDRLSEAGGEADRLRGVDGKLLCGN